MCFPLAMVASTTAPFNLMTFCKVPSLSVERRHFHRQGYGFFTFHFLCSPSDSPSLFVIKLLLPCRSFDCLTLVVQRVQHRGDLQENARISSRCHPRNEKKPAEMCTRCAMVRLTFSSVWVFLTFQSI